MARRKVVSRAISAGPRRHLSILIRCARCWGGGAQLDSQVEDGGEASSAWSRKSWRRLAARSILRVSSVRREGGGSAGAPRPAPTVPKTVVDGDGGVEVVVGGGGQARRAEEKAGRARVQLDGIAAGSKRNWPERGAESGDGWATPTSGVAIFSSEEAWMSSGLAQRARAANAARSDIGGAGGSPRAPDVAVDPPGMISLRSGQEAGGSGSK
jgi:hypothetical protein